MDVASLDPAKNWNIDGPLHSLSVSTKNVPTEELQPQMIPKLERLKKGNLVLILVKRGLNFTFIIYQLGQKSVLILDKKFRIYYLLGQQ